MSEAKLQEDLEYSHARAAQLILRALRYVAPFKREFAIKALFVVLSSLPLLILPWPTRILIDHVISGIPIGEQATPFPFFVEPFVALAANASRTELLIWTLAVQFTLLILVGAFGVSSRERDTADNGGIRQGWDTATRTENEANSGFSQIGGILGLFDYRWTLRLTQRLNHHYRSQLFDRIQSMPMSSLDDERIGDAVYRVMYDTTVITNTCYRLILTPIAAPMGILMTILVMGEVYGYDTPIIWAGLGFIFAAFLPTLPLARFQRRLSGRSRQAGSTTTSSIEESMSNMVAVQSLGAEDRERERFDRDSNRSFHEFRRKIGLDILGYFVAGVAGALLIAEVFLWVGDGIIEGRLTIGDFAVLLTFFGGIAYAASELGSLWIRLQDDSAGLNRVFFLIDASNEQDDRGEVELEGIGRGLRMRDVSFSYSGRDLAEGPEAARVDEAVLGERRQTLSHISLEAEIGKVVALSGPAGAGKSTIAYLIPRFLEPQSGSIEIDGRDIRDYTLSSLRERVAFVFQETMLFGDTIEANIRLAHPAASESEVRRAAQIAGAHDFIEAHPEGYRTRLGSAGAKLSVGQKQRISIARALVRTAEILILDEPTSALDPDTERRLVAALREASRTRIVIVIAHRLSTIREADEILFVEAGQIRERGDHQSLMARPDGAYRRYVELQTRGVA